MSTRLGVELRVSRVRRETPDAVSITFEVPPDLAQRFRRKAGQFLTIGVPSDRTGRVARCYSLCTAPDEDVTITVKRIDGGYASRWLTENAAPGLSLEVLPPTGTFTVPGCDQDVLLAAAGSGVTPVMSILRWLLAAGTGRVALFYANRDARSVIFAEELERLAGAHPGRLDVVHWLESERGLPGAEDLAEWAEDRPAGGVWTCGPGPFMDVVTKALRPVREVRREEYRSLAGDPFAPIELTVDEPAEGSDLEVTFYGEQHTLVWPPDRNLLEVLLAKGIDAPYSCRDGECGSCAARLEEGRVDMAITDALEPEDVEEGYILGCQALPLTDKLRITFD